MARLTEGLTECQFFISTDSVEIPPLESLFLLGSLKNSNPVMAIIKWIRYKKRPWCLQAAAYQGQSVGRHPPQIWVIQGNIICREFKNNDKMDKKSVCFLSLPWTSLLNNVSDKTLLPAGIPSPTAAPHPPLPPPCLPVCLLLFTGALQWGCGPIPRILTKSKPFQEPPYRSYVWSFSQCQSQ